MAAAVTAHGRRLGRYVLFDEIAAGGMATVHLGRLHGSVGFALTVAIKRLHPMYAKDPFFVAMFTDEARLAARIRHSNVAATLDVVSDGDELFVVMEYIHGEALGRLLRGVSARHEKVPVPVAVSIAVGTLHGLHAAHEATTEAGAPLRLVHRDVSPQNILVGVDGVARVLDFGIAKALGQSHTTENGNVRGKTAYMAPEQLQGAKADRRADVYAASVVLWETLTGHRLFAGDSAGEVGAEVLNAVVDPPSHFAPGIPPELDAIVLRGLSRDPARRFRTATEMAEALERAVALATAREVGRWVATAARGALAERAERLRHVEGAAERPAYGPATPAETSPVTMIRATLVAEKPRARLWAAIVVASVTVILAGALTVASTMRGVRGRAKDAASTIAPADDVDPTASAPSVTREGIAPPRATLAPAAAPPFVEIRPRTSPTGKAPRFEKRPLRRSCDPPYTIDKDGIHVPKAGCG